ncbi:lipopolysaccharide biosynthesis protein [Novosphingobium album (ex Liu et al. 2023)]|uniref:Lipopolysaccharide biosynthesis protein n=1 Tax=Novosphingobium album (ex Liu et al. 2023) TaxID=3031130 RepID=A0ABT5WLI6_9SPHN|nr:lipopolysaccharide biosynthesis protein [Novosphingobium album (ex Liu et al. 2023)]MDE8650896.1 lipopolysaccharide biosynthesis protein [Novosphingobium album (ex Liu et al. 2023)]
MSRLFRNIGWLLGGRGVNAVFSLVYLALATRMLGLQDFGRFSLIVVLAQAIAGVASFQTWQAVVRWGSIEGEQARSAGFALALDLLSIAAGSLVAALVCWSAPFWLPLPPELRLVAFAQCLAALVAIRSTPTGILRLHDRYDLATLAESTLPATRAAGAVLATVLWPRVAGFVAAWGIAELACAATYWWLARGLTPVRLADVSLTALPRRHAGVWRFVWATNLSRSLAISAKQAILLLVGALGGAGLAGGYRVASQLGQALVQLGEAVSRAIYPEFVRAGKAARALSANMVRLAAGTSVLALVLAWIGGKWAILLLAGPEYGFAHGALVILACGGALELLGASWDALLVARARAETAFAIRAVPQIATLFAMPLAIAGHGLAGVAACVLVGSLLTVIGLGLAVQATHDLPEPA